MRARREGRSGLPSAEKTSPKGVVAAVYRARANDDDAHRSPERPSAGDHAWISTLRSDCICDAEKDAILTVEELNRAAPGPHRGPHGSGIQLRADAAKAFEQLWVANPDRQRGEA